MKSDKLIYQALTIISYNEMRSIYTLISKTIMKNLVYLFVLLTIPISSGCTDDILMSKDGSPIQPVQNLDFVLNNNELILTWDLPANYPSDIILPVSVRVDIYSDGVLLESTVIPESPVSFLYNGYSADKSFRFVVKVRGEVNSENPYMAKVRLSPGRVAVL